MDELDLIHDLVAAVPGPSVESRHAARQALRGQMLGTSQRPKPRRGRFWKRLVPVVTVAILLAAGAQPVMDTVVGGRHQMTAAAAALLAASRTAAQQPAHTLQPGQFAYTKSEGAYLDQVSTGSGTWGALVRTEREIWVGPDGSGRIRQVSKPPVFLASADRARWEQAGAPPLTFLTQHQTYDMRFGAGQLSPPLDLDGFTAQQLLDLANDPAALSGAIQREAEKTDNPLGFEMLTIVGDLLSETAAPPQLRAALYRVAADIPGVQLVGPVSDRAGRHGIAVAASRSDIRLVLIFDPATSALLAKEETLLQPLADTSAPTGAAIAYTLYLQSGVTPSVTSRDVASRAGLLARRVR